MHSWLYHMAWLKLLHLQGLCDNAKKICHSLHGYFRLLTFPKKGGGEAENWEFHFSSIACLGYVLAK